MDDKKLLEQIGNMFTANTALLRKEMREMEERLTDKMEKTVKKSQEDTIEILTEVIQESHDSYEKRIQRLEKHVGLPPLD